MQYSTMINNGSGAEVRASINNAFQSVLTDFAGATDPSTMTPSCAFPYCTWLDTSNGLLKRRNASNTAWASVGTVDVDGNVVLYGIYGQSGAMAVTADATLTVADANKLIIVNSSSAVTLTVPASPTQYTTYKIYNKGAGALTITGSTFYDETGSASNVSLSQYQSISLSSDGTSYYAI